MQCWNHVESLAGLYAEVRRKGHACVMKSASANDHDGEMERLVDPLPLPWYIR
jgi:hypothetical protein